MLLALMLALGGCATATTNASAPLPDARDLAENPLDVTKIPQP